MRLENGKISIDIKSLGAELTSLKYKGKEFLWQADKRYWGRYAPVLFPIVGKLKDNAMYIENKEYSMGQHGFARDSEFINVFDSHNKVTYLLSYNEETLKVYPYKFELYISYEVFDNQVRVTYEVKNIDNKDIYFSIGGHPAFKWPLVEEETSEDYYIEFEKNETQRFIKNENGCLSYQNEFILEDTNIIELNKSKFDIDTFTFKNLNSNKISLKSKKTGAFVTVYFEGFPYLGIWSRTDEANFICIEPWYGLADFINHNKDFKTKEGILQLKTGDNFKCSYVIEVGG